jgi:hypothetical protein
MQKHGKGGKHIVVSDDNYEISASLGNINSSFDSVITDLLKSSAGAALNKEKEEEEK